MTNKFTFLALLVFVLSTSAPDLNGDDHWRAPKKSNWAKKPFKPLPMQEARVILKESKDRDKLLQASLSLCRDPKPEAIPALMDFLKTKDFLDRLDQKVDYDRRDTRLEAILTEMFVNSGPAWFRRYLQVTRSGLYKEERGEVMSAAVDEADKPRDLLVRPIPYDDAVAALEKSKDRDYLLQVALSLCRDKKPEAIPTLMKFLKSSEFIDRLDSEDDFPRNEHRIAIIIQELAKVSSEKVEQRLIDLAETKFYQGETVKNRDRRLPIIKAAAVIKSPSPKILVYLESQMKPVSPEERSAISALILMRSPAATKIVEKHILAAPRVFNIPGPLSAAELETLSKVSWMENDFVPLRHEPDILAIYRKLLSSKIDDEELREGVVQTLFSYSRRWYGRYDTNPPKPKPWSEISTDSLQEFLKLSDLSLKFGISDETKAMVEESRKQIKEVLAKREKDKK